VLEAHIEDMHPPILFNRSLDTPEEIEKWIQERKAKYPTDANVEKKKSEKRSNPDTNGTESQSHKKKKQKKENEKVFDQDGKQVCKFHLKGKCKKGDECTYSHNYASAGSRSTDDTEQQQQQKTRQPQVKQTQKPTRSNLLRKLLDDEIQKERKQVLDCIDFIVANNFFEGMNSGSVEDSADKWIEIREKNLENVDIYDAAFDSDTDESDDDGESENEHDDDEHEEGEYHEEHEEEEDNEEQIDANNGAEAGEVNEYEAAIKEPEGTETKDVQDTPISTTNNQDALAMAIEETKRKLRELIAQQTQNTATASM
jgi:hypothetical protein